MSNLEELFQQEASRDDFNPEKRKRVGGYILGRILGEGSFAKVRLGFHIQSKEKVAIKVINKKVVHKKDYVRKNMRREAAVLQRLDHPNIARLYEILETENSFYLVEELVQGADMMEYLNKKNGVSEGQARRFVRQIVSALGHMHRSGVVHRDLKVENLLLDKELSVKIIDFGLSNFCAQGDILSTQCGSPAYSAPEVFSKQQYGPAVDIWTVGVNLYAMVTGRLPFTADPPNNLTKLHAAMLKGCDYPNYLSQGCRDLLRRMLEVSDTRRITLRELMAHPWLNADYIPLEQWDLKTKLREEDLDLGIVDYMTESLNYKVEDIKDSVINLRPTAVAATYHLLEQRAYRSMTASDRTAATLEKENQDPVVKMPRVDQEPSLTRSPTGLSYKECLRQLKETRKRNILKRRPISTSESQAAIETVAEVNKSYDENANEKDSVVTPVKMLGVSLKTNQDEAKIQKKPPPPKVTESELRTLSNRFLQNYAINTRYATYKPQVRHTTKNTKDPSHRLLAMMKKYGADRPSAPPAPPNSAQARQHLEALPNITPMEEAENLVDSKTHEKALNHKCSSSKRPVVWEREGAVPESSIDRFYERYRFKVRNTEGERMHTWDLHALENPPPTTSSVASSQRSRTSSEFKLKNSRLMPERRVPFRERTFSDPGKVSYKDLGLSYTVPEHSVSIPRARPHPNTSRGPSINAPARCSLPSTSTKTVGISGRDLLYASLRTRMPTLVMKEPIKSS